MLYGSWFGYFHEFSYHRFFKSLNDKILNTKEFIHALAERLQVSHKEAARLLDATSQVWRESLAEEESITLQKLGNFQLKTKKSRIAYIPALGKKALVPPHKVLQFHPSEYLKKKFKNYTRP